MTWLFRLSLCSGLLLVGPAAGGAASATSIGVSISHMDENFLTIVREGIESAAKQKKDVNVQFEDAGGDIGKQISQVQNFIARHVDAIIVNAVDSDEASKVDKLAIEAKIPLVWVNRGPIAPSLPAGIAFVASDNTVAGVMQGEELARQLHGQGKVVIIQGELSDQATGQRTKGVESVIARYPGMQIVGKQVANYQRTEAIDLMNNWLVAGDKIDAVAANNDEMAIGAILALHQARRVPGSVIVAGVDATKDGLQEIKSGAMAFTVFQDGRGQGAAALDLAVAMASHTATGSSIVMIPFQLVTKANESRFENK